MRNKIILSAIFVLGSFYLLESLPLYRLKKPIEFVKAFLLMLLMLVV